MSETEELWTLLTTTIPSRLTGGFRSLRRGWPVIGRSLFDRWSVMALATAVTEHLTAVDSPAQVRRRMESSASPALDHLVTASELRSKILETVGSSCYLGLASPSRLMISLPTDARIYIEKLDDDSFTYEIFYIDGLHHSIEPLRIIDESDRTVY